MEKAGNINIGFGELMGDMSCPGADRRVEDIEVNSSKCRESTVFVCISGSRDDGHLHALEAYEKGCRTFVCERPLPLPPDADQVVCADTRAELAVMSARFYGEPAKKLRLIAVTGTKGKTTVSQYICDCLNRAGHRAAIVGTDGAVICGNRTETANTTPDSLTLNRIFYAAVSAGCEYVVLEVSSQAVKQRRVDGLHYAVAVFTNLSPDHISPTEHLSFEEYRECKLRVLQSADTAVINADDPSGAYMMSRLRIPCFTVSSTKGDYVISHESSMRDGNGISTVFTVSRGDNNCRIRVRQPGMYSAYNAALAYAACRCENVEAHDVTAALGATVMRGRFEMIPLGAGRTAVIDCAHNKASLQAVLEVVRAEARKNGGRVLCLVGAPGGKAVNRRIGLAQAASGLSDIVILTSDNPDSEDPEKILDQMERGLVNGFKDYFRIADRESAIRYAVSLMRQGDVLLLAGKGNEDYQLVNGVKIPFSERGILAEEALGAPV